jgi:hypothetical protein
MKYLADVLWLVGGSLAMLGLGLWSPALAMVVGGLGLLSAGTAVAIFNNRRKQPGG